MIKPTIGRIVWYNEADYNRVLQIDPKQSLAAIVAYVHSDTMVNLAVFDAVGGIHARTSVMLCQPNTDPGGASSWCEWMPYQVGQAKRHEADDKPNVLAAG